MAYASGEFYTGMGDPYKAFAQSAVAIFNDTVYVLGTGVDTESQNKNIYQMTFDLTKLVKTSDGSNIYNDSGGSGSNDPDDPINAQNLTDTNCWNFELLSDLELLWTPSRPALATTPDAMYFFFNPRSFDDSGENYLSSQILTTQFTLPSDPTKPGSWSQPITLYETDGQTTPNTAPLASLDATVVGDNMVIVTCANASSTSGAGAFVGLYDATQIDVGNGSWKAQWQTYLEYQNVPANTVTAQWFSTVVNGSLEYNLLVVTQPQTDNTGANIRSWLLPMTVTETNGITQVSLFNPMGQLGGSSEGFLSAMVRDPAGRFRTWISPIYADDPPPSATLSAGITGTATLPDGANSPPISLTSESFTTSDTSIPPSSVFYVFEKGQSETTVNNKSATDYPVYEFIFYGRNAFCQTFRAATLQTVPGYSVCSPQNPTDPNTNTEIVKNVIAGIIDGPIPLPKENYENYTGTLPTDPGTLFYGTTDSTVKSRQVSNSWTAGFEASGEATEGVGIAFDISLKGGTGSVQTQSDEESYAYTLTNPAQVSLTSPYVFPYGSLLQVGVQFSISAFSYLDIFGQSVDSTVSDPANAIKSANVLTSFVEPAVLSFTPYAVTPGDLTSYLPKNINTTMAHLGYTNYFGDVISQNAYPFGNQNQPYLLFSWSEGASEKVSFSEINSSYQENSWTFDLKTYAGVSVGGGFDIFGLGENFQAKFLAGISYSHEASQSENTSNTWQVSTVNSSFGPLNRPDQQNSVKSYKFRVYFLPPPQSPYSKLPATYWTTELMNNMPANSDTQAVNIDPNTGCWRIFYAVTEIVYRNGQTFTYDNSLDMDSVYPVEN